MKSGPRPAIQVRTAFISDIHLGSRDCRADLVLDFLHRVQPEQLILVGDIIDLWSLRRSFYWPQSHSDVLRTILGKSKHGTRVIYVPGNHDEQFRQVCSRSVGHRGQTCSPYHRGDDAFQLRYVDPLPSFLRS